MLIGLSLCCPLAAQSATSVDAAAHAAVEHVPVRPAPRVGQPYGPLLLPTLEGSTQVDLADYRGRKLLLIEFASW
jgi:hypothetical protein